MRLLAGGRSYSQRLWDYAGFVNPEDNLCSMVKRSDDLLGLVDLFLEALNFVSQLGHPSGN